MVKRKCVKRFWLKFNFGAYIAPVSKVQNIGQKRKFTKIDPIDPIFWRTMIFHHSTLTEICFAGKNHSKTLKIKFSKSAAWVTWQFYYMQITKKCHFQKFFTAKFDQIFGIFHSSWINWYLETLKNFFSKFWNFMGAWEWGWKMQNADFDGGICMIPTLLCLLSDETCSFRTSLI